MKRSIFYISGLLIVLVVGTFAYKKASTYIKDQKEIKRKAEIKGQVLNHFKNCPDLTTFEKRRECFKEEMITKRAQNQQVKLEYVFLINNKRYKAEGVDLGDVMQITKPEGYGFTRCVANTYFFDWVGEHIYFSLENAQATISCKTTTGGDLIIFPKDLTETELRNSTLLLKTEIK